MGAVFSQHFTDPRLSPMALDLLPRGETAEQARDAVLAAAPGRDWRQLALIDRHSNTAALSGTKVQHDRHAAPIDELARLLAAYEPEADDTREPGAALPSARFITPIGSPATP